MPVHLYWGDDEAARERAIEALIGQVVDPAWQSLNLSRLDGRDPDQALQALAEARTPPLGGGARLVLLQASPFAERCPADLADRVEADLALVPESCHLVLSSSGKPDARLRTTKALRAVADERSFVLPTVWDGAGQRQLVERMAADRGLRLEPGAADALADAVGSDSARLAMELEKLDLHADGGPIRRGAVAALVQGHSHTSLQVGESLLDGQLGLALQQLDDLLAANEPALRIVAALVGQLRGWLWVSLLDRQGEQDVAVIAKAAGIGNPKRIYVLRRQLRGRGPDVLLPMLEGMLEVERLLKLGTRPADAFRDGLLPLAAEGR